MYSFVVKRGTAIMLSRSHIKQGNQQIARPHPDCTRVLRQVQVGTPNVKSRRKARCYPPTLMILLLRAVVLYLNSLLRIVGKEVCG